MGSCLTFMYLCFMCQLRLYLLVPYMPLFLFFFSFLFFCFFSSSRVDVYSTVYSMFSSGHLNLPSCLEAEDI